MYTYYVCTYVVLDERKGGFVLFCFVLFCFFRRRGIQASITPQAWHLDNNGLSNSRPRSRPAPLTASKHVNRNHTRSRKPLNPRPALPRPAPEDETTGRRRGGHWLFCVLCLCFVDGHDGPLQTSQPPRRGRGLSVGPVRGSRFWAWAWAWASHES